MLYYDPTEGDTDTRVLKTLLRASRSLPGLEELTGADWLITPTDEETRLTKLRLPAEKDELLAQCQKGVLVQRKAGRDAVQSIPEFTRILSKMCTHSPMNWLVTIGNYTRTVQNKVVVDGDVTGWDWNAWIGALTSWQYRGLNGTSGYYINLPTDSAFTDWCLWQDKHVVDGLPDITFVARYPQQKIVIPDEVAPEQQDAIRILLQIPGVGLESALKLWQFTGSLKMLFMLLSDPDIFKKMKKADSKSKKLLNGVGIETVWQFRALMGLGTQTVDETVTYEVLVPTYDGQALIVTEKTIEIPSTPY